jgi:hypothetical protein
MRRALETMTVTAALLVGGVLLYPAPAEAGGGGRVPVVIASGYGFAEPTLLDTARAGSVVRMLNHNGAARVLSSDAGRIEANRARVDLWLFEPYLNICPAATFTYRQECARETITYYPAIGDAQAALFVRGGVTFEAGALLQVMLGELGLPTRIEPPSIAAPSAVEARARASTYDRVVWGAGALAIGLGAAFIGGAVVAMRPAREVGREAALRHRGPARASWFDRLTMGSA